MSPYMIMLIDHGGQLMENLPVSVGRLVTQGGEYLNYDDQSYYYKHTMRHGGKNHPDPIQSLLFYKFRRFHFKLLADKSHDGQTSLKLFEEWYHKNACADLIQKWW